MTAQIHGYVNLRAVLVMEKAKSKLLLWDKELLDFKEIQQHAFSSYAYKKLQEKRWFGLVKEKRNINQIIQWMHLAEIEANDYGYRLPWVIDKPLNILRIKAWYDEVEKTRNSARAVAENFGDILISTTLWEIING